MQLVIFLYLLDNETSTVVLFSAGIGTLIEFWKVTKAMKVSIDWSRGFPLPKFEDKAGVTCMLCVYYCLYIPDRACHHFTLNLADTLRHGQRRAEDQIWCLVVGLCCVPFFKMSRLSGAIVRH